MWVRELAWIEPIVAASHLSSLGRLSLLHSARTDPSLGEFSYLAADPFATFRVRAGQAYWNDAPEAAAPIAALRARLARYRITRKPQLPPFQGGAIGLVGYEFGWTLEGRVPPMPSQDDELHLGFYDVVLAFDHAARRCWLIASGFPALTEDERQRRAAARLDLFCAHLDRNVATHRAEMAASEDLGEEVIWQAEVDRARFCAGIEQVRDYIRAGDIYQANLAQRFTAPRPKAHPLALYARLCAANPAPFAAYLDLGTRHILSSSPELFLRSDGAQVETRPIKGTIKRFADEAEDAAAALRLARSRKDQAENVMIVDLLRNDLSRVCLPHSVDVPALCVVETYAGLHHLVSVVVGRLGEDRDGLDLLAATFPGGSITGAPKIRAMEIIAEIEGRARGAYCGSIGAIGFDGSLQLNIAIRTLVLSDDQMELCTGGGITILSDPAAEYEETLVKARRILNAFVPLQRPAKVSA
jgi:para-aminobenzoate synthetase component 1